MTPRRILLALALLATPAAGGDAFAQAGCQPTLSRPCKPAPSSNAQNPFAQLPERFVSDDRPAMPLPRLQLDNNTTVGVGVGSGVFGLESRW
jgi:hypothetical protein